MDRIRGLSYQEIAERGGGILNSAKTLRSMSEDDLYAVSLERMERLMRMGTGAIEIKSGYGLDMESELKMPAWRGVWVRSTAFPSRPPFSVVTQCRRGGQMPWPTPDTWWMRSFRP